MDGFGNPAADSRPKKKLVRPRHTLLSESARKRRLAQREAARTKVIRISEQQTRWDALKQALGLRTNACVAKVLLDYYETSTLIPIHHVTISTPSLATSRVCSEAEPLAGPSEVRWSTPATKGTEPDVIHTPGQSETSGSAAGSERATSRVWSEAEPLAGPSEVRWSTPATKGTGHEVMHTPGLSEISGSAAGSESDCQLSGIERFPVTDSQSEEQISPKQGGTESLTETRAARASKGPSDSFLDPFNVTFEVTLQSETEEVRMNDDDDDDPDYEPSFCLEAILPAEVETIPVVNMVQMIFGDQEEEAKAREEEKEKEGEEEAFPFTKGIHLINEQELDELASSPLALCFVDQVKELAITAITACKTDKCGKPVSIQHSFVGSALYLKWVCLENHVSHTWCSQPVLNRRLHSGDFLLAMAIMTSGNNFAKVELLGKFLNLGFISKSSFFKIQSHYIVPTIDEYWKEHQTAVLETLNNQEVVVLGDGRNDSPGYSAQYSTYSLMDSASKQILTLQTVDKRETDKKSPLMETEGFKRAMEDLLDKKVNVTEVVTDAHTGIGAVMKNTYPNMMHSHDIWHAAKNLTKSLTKLGSLKKHAVLRQWIRDIVNHFWYTCREAKDYEEFLGLLCGVLHHITNEHVWALGKCRHEELTGSDRTKPWLDASKDRDTIAELASILLNPRLLSKVKHYLNFRSTSDLEVFHQHILMYCAKRYAYTPPVYRARNLLAALDHNFHASRATKTGQDGQIQYHRCYNKKSGQWSVFPVKENKTYGYIKDLTVKALIKRMNDNHGMKRKRELEEADPRRISRTIMGQDPPPTAQLSAEQVSRFSKE